MTLKLYGTRLPRRFEALSTTRERDHRTPKHNGAKAALGAEAPKVRRRLER
jgi:hypothetical protein